MSYSQFTKRPQFYTPTRPGPFPTDLSSLQVGWLKADTKAIQAVGDSVITHNPRVSVSHEKLQMHKLHITDVQLDDEGVYMCQLNTSPMKSQVNGGFSEGERRGRAGHLESTPRLRPAPARSAMMRGTLAVASRTLRVKRTTAPPPLSLSSSLSIVSIRRRATAVAASFFSRRE